VEMDERYMRMALGLARKGEGLTNPNPMVGALVVRNGKIVGEGFHKRCGEPHAEANAIKDAGSMASGSTLYVTLEPCDHYGRTPPCTDAVINSGIKRVVIGMTDPNPVNNGKGLSRLKAHGIKTRLGILEAEARLLNKAYIKFITRKEPYVTLKLAQSLDGKIATRTGDSRWISCGASRDLVRSFRGKVDAVMIGANTAIKDDPSLMAKDGAKQPCRIVVDGELKLPPGAKLFSNLKLSPVILAASRAAAKKKGHIYESMHVKVLPVSSKGGRLDLKEMLKSLGRMNMMHVLVEGGGVLAAGLIEKRLADEIIFLIAPKIIGGRDAVTSVEGKGPARISGAIPVKRMTVRRSGDDIIVTGELN